MQRVTDQLDIPVPDDFHLHLRDGELLRAVVAESARWFGRAIVMPNLASPVVTVAQAFAYRERIVRALPANNSFVPLMTLYLTDQMTVAEVKRAGASDVVFGIKLYPAHATTNSAHGVTDVAALDPVLDAMADMGLPLLIHGEKLGPDIDVFDREKVFIKDVLIPLVRRHPQLRVVLEHITTEEGVQFVLDGPETVGGTLTAHHLLLDRNDMFRGGLRPHHYCLPVLKRMEHKRALRRAIRSGHPRLFLGTDSAPHPISAKEASHCCAGLYTAPLALALYAQVFDEEGALKQFGAFASHRGQAFYGLPVNLGRIRLSRQSRPVEVPERVLVAPGVEILPFYPEDGLHWRAERI
ncbi:MAG: dihydroorotase [Myxococcales bacterium]|nr:dihydroorotase [Myxococcales bacterium]